MARGDPGRAHRDGRESWGSQGQGVLYTECGLGSAGLEGPHSEEGTSK
jgi:hypothetical protein